MMPIVDNILFYVVGLLYEAWGIYRLWKNIQTPDKPPGLFSRIKKTFLGPFRAIAKCIGIEGDAVGPFLLVVIMASIQVAFNYLSAYLIETTSNYKHVPVGLLALLFCARPRRSWLLALLPSIPDSHLGRYAKLETSNSLIRFQKSLLKSGSKAALGEYIMLCIGIYSMGKTATIGFQIGFYLWAVHPPLLSHVKDAALMYVAAFGSIIALSLFTIVWVIIVFWSSIILRFLSLTKEYLIAESKRQRVDHSDYLRRLTIEPGAKSLYYQAQEEEVIDEDQVIPAYFRCQKWVLQLGLIAGWVSYICQWLSWIGFLRTANSW
jgi:hypothetical protein